MYRTNSGIGTGPSPQPKSLAGRSSLRRPVPTGDHVGTPSTPRSPNSLVPPLLLSSSKNQGPHAAAHSRSPGRRFASPIREHPSRSSSHAAPSAQPSLSTSASAAALVPSWARKPPSQQYAGGDDKPWSAGNAGRRLNTNTLALLPGDVMKTKDYDDPDMRRHMFSVLPGSSYAAAMLEGVAYQKEVERQKLILKRKQRLASTAHGEKLPYRMASLSYTYKPKGLFEGSKEDSLDLAFAPPQVSGRSRRPTSRSTSRSGARTLDNLALNMSGQEAKEQWEAFTGMPVPETARSSSRQGTARSSRSSRNKAVVSSRSGVVTSYRSQYAPKVRTVPRLPPSPLGMDTLPSLPLQTTDLGFQDRPHTPSILKTPGSTRLDNRPSSRVRFERPGRQPVAPVPDLSGSLALSATNDGFLPASAALQDGSTAGAQHATPTQRSAASAMSKASSMRRSHSTVGRVPTQTVPEQPQYPPQLGHSASFAPTTSVQHMKSLSSFRVLEHLENRSNPVAAASSLLQHDVSFMGSSADVSDALRRELELRAAERPATQRTADTLYSEAYPTERSSSSESDIADPELREEATSWAAQQLQPFNDMLTERSEGAGDTSTGRHPNELPTFRPGTGETANMQQTMTITNQGAGPGPAYTSNLPAAGMTNLPTDKFTGEFGQPFDFDKHGSRIQRLVEPSSVPPLNFGDSVASGQGGDGQSYVPTTPTAPTVSTGSAVAAGHADGSTYTPGSRPSPTGSRASTRSVSELLSSQRHSGDRSSAKTPATEQMSIEQSIRYDFLDFRARAKVIRLQALARGYILRKELAVLHAHAAIIQRQFRWHSWWMARQRAALVIQCAIRRHLAISAVEYVRAVREHHAAVDIQRVYRGMKGRWVFSEELEEYREEWEEELISAILIQSVYRGFRVRYTEKWKGYYAEVIQHTWYGWKRKKASMEKEVLAAMRRRQACASFIQIYAKSWVSRIELERRKQAAEWRERERLGQEGKHVMQLVRERLTELMRWFSTRKGQSSVKAEAKVLRKAIELKKAERQGRVALVKDLRLWTHNGEMGIFTPPPKSNASITSSLPFMSGVDTVKSPAAVASASSKRLLATASVVPQARGAAASPQQSRSPSHTRGAGGRVDPARQQSWKEIKTALNASLGSAGPAQRETWSGHPPTGTASTFKSIDRSVSKRCRGADIAAPPTSAPDTPSLTPAATGLYGLAPTADEEVMEEEALLRDVFEVFTSEGVKGLDPSLVALLCLQGGVRLKTDDQVIAAFELLDADGDGVVGLNDLLKFVWSSEDLNDTAKVAKKNKKHVLKVKGKTQQEKVVNEVKLLLFKLKTKLRGKRVLADIFSTSEIFNGLATRVLIKRAEAETSAKARRDFRLLYPPAYECEDCLQAFPLYVPYWIHTRYGCVVERRAKERGGRYTSHGLTVEGYENALTAIQEASLRREQYQRKLRHQRELLRRPRVPKFGLDDYLQGGAQFEGEEKGSEEKEDGGGVDHVIAEDSGGEEKREESLGVGSVDGHQELGGSMEGYGSEVYDNSSYFDLGSSLAGASAEEEKSTVFPTSDIVAATRSKRASYVDVPLWHGGQSKK